MVTLNNLLGLLLGYELVLAGRFVRIKGTYDVCNNVKIHCVTNHSVKFSIWFGPFPSCGFHALGFERAMAPHPPASFHRPLSASSRGEEAFDFGGASGKSG